MRKNLYVLVWWLFDLLLGGKFAVKFLMFFVIVLLTFLVLFVLFAIFGLVSIFSEAIRFFKNNLKRR